MDNFRKKMAPPSFSSFAGLKPAYDDVDDVDDDDDDEEEEEGEGGGGEEDPGSAESAVTSADHVTAATVDDVDINYVHPGSVTKLPAPFEIATTTTTTTHMAVAAAAA